MNILILANHDVGLYQFRRELIGELLKAHAVTIALPKGDLVRPLEEMGCTFLDIPVDRRGMSPAADFALLLRYRNMLRMVNPDLVITYTIKPNIYGGLACRFRHVPYAANITGLGTAFQRGGLLCRFVTVLYKLALKNAKTVFFENEENREALLGAGIVQREQCCLLNGAGVNLAHYSPAPYPADVEETRFLFIGRVMKEKGIEELLTAMEQLQADRVPCTLDVLGGCEEDYAPLLARYEETGWLHYHGYQKDVRPFIARAHCFVLPSWHEGMANTNLECAAMARPVITSRIHGCMEAVEEGVSGLLCERQNADSLYLAMRQFAELPSEKRRAMGAAGRRRMEARFDKEKVVAATLERIL